MTDLNNLNNLKRKYKMIKEDYVSYEAAKLLKEKGFDVPTIFVWYEHLPEENAAHKSDINKQCLDYFYSDRYTEINTTFSNGFIPPYIYGDVYSAPTLQMAMKWLREVHNIFIQVELYSKLNDYCFEVFKNTHRMIVEKDEVYNTYEQAVEEAIKYCLENLI